ncbi:hypothetical protein, partial [Leptospira idonii]
MTTLGSGFLAGLALFGIGRREEDNPIASVKPSQTTERVLDDTPNEISEIKPYSPEGADIPADKYVTVLEKTADGETVEVKIRADRLEEYISETGRREEIRTNSARSLIGDGDNSILDGARIRTESDGTVVYRLTSGIELTEIEVMEAQFRGRLNPEGRAEYDRLTEELKAAELAES